MKISIYKRRTKKGLSHLHLVYYLGYQKNENGKVKPKRKFENLNVFLYDKPKNQLEKQHNKETTQLVEAIKSKRLVEYQSGQHDFKNPHQGKTSFLKRFENLIQDKQKTLSASSCSIWDSAYKQLRKFDSRPDILMDDLTSEYIKDFKAYLEHSAKSRHDTPIKTNTANRYFDKFSSVVKDAYRNGLLKTDPLLNIKGVKLEATEREYLEISEVKRLVETPCKNALLKRAFLFSCLTGLRWSDIYKLTWNEITQTDSGQRIVFKQKKTGGLQHLDLSEQAFGLFDNRSSEKPFYGLLPKSTTRTNNQLLKWCIDAGITKHISFHSARHTFAVAQLTMGTDIYTVSKLLGHSELKTTQIYADIIDTVRKKAMHQMPDIGL